MKKQKPERLKNVISKIKISIEQGNYALSFHAMERQRQRIITLPAILNVLKNGTEEKQKTSFDEAQNTWKYAIRGKNLDKTADVRIIVAFHEINMIIITVMVIGKYGKN